MISQNKRELLTNWFAEGKLESSEELGDLLSGAGDKDMALKIYQQCGATGKVRRRWSPEQRATCLMPFFVCVVLHFCYPAKM